MSNAMTGKHCQLYRPLSAWLLAIVGAGMVLIGAYFIFVRPPLRQKTCATWGRLYFDAVYRPSDR